MLYRAKKISFLNRIIIAIPFFLFSCAQVLSPTGGPKDTQPPRVVKFIPDSAAVNFSGSTIIVAFDEYIQLKSLQEQLIISPPLTNRPEVTVKRKELHIQLNETLKPNTTYTFNFGTAVADITEGNATDNFSVMFSTGPAIDSLTLSGTVINAFTLQPEKGVLVMLYSGTDDSLPIKTLPDYFTKTNAFGSFSLRCLKADSYKIIALKDANANYKYDAEQEMIAFANNRIVLPGNDTIHLPMFKEEFKRLFLKKAYSPAPACVVLVFNKPAAKMNIKPLNFTPKDNSQWKYEQYSALHDTITIWLPAFEKDSFCVALKEGDMHDTVCLKLTSPGKSDKLISKPRAKNIAANEKFSIKFIPPLDVEQLQWDCSEFLKNNSNWQYSKCVCEYDALADELRVFYVDLSGNEIEWQQEAEYKIVFPPSTLKSVLGSVNADTIQHVFRINSNDQYGSLKMKLNVEHLKGAVLFHLLDAGGRVVEERFYRDGNFYLIQNGLKFSEKGYETGKSNVYSVEKLLPGMYSLRVIADVNGNDRYDAGDYLKHIQPEKIWYYPTPINIRSNWDLELEWELK